MGVVLALAADVDAARAKANGAAARIGVELR